MVGRTVRVCAVARHSFCERIGRRMFFGTLLLIADKDRVSPVAIVLCSCKRDVDVVSLFRLFLFVLVLLSGIRSRAYWLFSAFQLVSVLFCG